MSYLRLLLRGDIMDSHFQILRRCNFFDLQNVNTSTICEQKKKIETGKTNKTIIKFYILHRFTMRWCLLKSYSIKKMQLKTRKNQKNPDFSGRLVTLASREPRADIY